MGSAIGKDGVGRADTFYSFFGTCKRWYIDPQSWLTFVINNINDTKTTQLKELLPQFIDKALLK